MPSKKSMIKRPVKKSVRKILKLSKPMTAAIQKITHGDIENKQAFNTLDLTAFNSGINSTGDAIQIVPNISVGASDNQRIGDQLRVQRLSIRGHIISAFSIPNAQSNCRIAVRMMIVQPRYISSYPIAVTNATTWMGGLLKKGGVTTGFSGTISDLYAPINSDFVIKYYDKVMYLPTPLSYAGTGTTNVNTLGSFDISKTVKFFNINLKLRNKLLKYDSTISNLLPTNYSPVFLLGYVHLDNTSPDIVSTQVSCAFDASLLYEDA